MKRLLPLLAVVPAAVIATVPLIDGLLRGPVLDASVFAMVAETMRDGGMPYRDVFDHKPPGIYIAQVALGSVTPGLDPWSVLWAVTLIAALATLIVLGMHLVPRWPLGATLALASLAPLVGARYFAQGGGETESLAILPATAALFVLASGKGRHAAQPLAAGVLMGLAGITSFQAAPAVLGLLVAAFARGGWRAAGAYLGGGAAVGAGTAAWLAVDGALPEALDQLIAYNRAYATGQNFLAATPLFLIALATLMIAPALAAALTRIHELIRSGAASPAELGAIVWLLSWAVLLVAQGQFIGHYATILIAPLALLAAPVLDRIARSVTDPRTRPVGLAVVAVSFLLPLLIVSRTEPGPGRRPAIDAASAAVARLTAEDDRIFVWGNEPFVYLGAGRDPAMQYVYFFPLTNPNYTTSEQVADIVAELTAHPPAVVVDASLVRDGPSTVPLLGPVRLGIVPAVDMLDPLRSFVHVRYRLETTAGGWPIYVRHVRT